MFSESKPQQKKKKKKKTMNADIREQGKAYWYQNKSKNRENKHFHGEPKSLKQKGIKTKIKSKPFQQKNSIKSNISYPKLKK